MYRIKHGAIWTLSVLIFCTFFPIPALGAEAPSAGASTPIVQRISGKDRIATSIAAAQTGWSTADTVILNEYTDYPDAIASTPLAVKFNAPVLLTTGNQLDPRVMDELQHLQPKKVILLGGQGRLQPMIESELTDQHFNWERIGGMDRYETSVLIAEQLNSDSMILVNGDDFPDALSAASFAGIQQIPILLASNPHFPQAIKSFYTSHKPSHVIVVGGEGVLPNPLLLDQGITVETRLGGSDRYETDSKLYQYAQASYTSSSFYLASGEQYPDAMVGTVLAAKNKAPLLITNRASLPDSMKSLFQPSSLVGKSVYILGGTSVVSGRIQALLENKNFAQNLLIGKTIIVDAGHGTPDPGAKGPSGTLEKDNNLAISLDLANLLRSSGANVVLSRPGDSSPAASDFSERADLQKRVDVANQNNADLFISIHNDSWSTAQGTTTYYSSDNPSSLNSYRLAQAIQSQLVSTIHTQDHGVKDARFYVLRNNTMPAVLVEVAYISNPVEEKELSDPNFREQAAEGISNGILQYVRSQEGL